jgi:hypothetical protein
MRSLVRVVPSSSPAQSCLATARASMQQCGGEGLAFRCAAQAGENTQPRSPNTSSTCRRALAQWLARGNRSARCRRRRVPRAASRRVPWSVAGAVLDGRRPALPARALSRGGVNGTQDPDCHAAPPDSASATWRSSTGVGAGGFVLTEIDLLEISAVSSLPIPPRWPCRGSRPTPTTATATVSRASRSCATANGNWGWAWRPSAISTTGSRWRHWVKGHEPSRPTTAPRAAKAIDTRPIRVATFD